MGANPTQASGVALFLVAFTAISVGLYYGSSMLWILVGIALLGGSAALFLKAKPWEHREE
jgi:hypothetical protein